MLAVVCLLLRAVATRERLQPGLCLSARPGEPRASQPGWSGQREKVLHSWSVTFPGREEEPVDDSRLPNVVVAGGGELARVAGKNSGVVRQVVVEAEVCALRVHQRHAVADIRVVEAEGLLHAEKRFKPANKTVEASKGLRAVIELDPITLRVLSAVELRP